MNGDESMNQDKIDKNIPTPLYYQLLQILKSQIETGRLEPGDVIPTEKELMEKYEISRATVRQAVLQLVNDGYLRREKSKGTFVTKPASKFRFIEGLRGFSAEMRDRNIPYQSKVLEKRVISADQRVAQRLDVNQGEQVFFLKRLRFVNDSPFLVDYHYLPYKFCPGIEEIIGDNVSLYSTLENVYGLKFHHGWREFEPISPSKEDIELLGIYSTTGLLFVESVVFDKNNIPVDYFEARIHGRLTVDTIYTDES